MHGGHILNSGPCPGMQSILWELRVCCTQAVCARDDRFANGQVERCSFVCFKPLHRIND